MKVKRILAVFLMIILTLVPITAVSAFSGGIADLGASDFKPRLTAPSKSNKYYYSNMNTFYAIGYGMPNCTAYAWGRAYEILGTQPKLSVNGAYQWWSYNKNNKIYPYGKTPKLGAVACWSYPGNGGHVAVVEKITSTTITMSHSAYSGKTFYTKDYPINSSLNVNGYTFQGFIYIRDGVKEPDGDIYRVDSANGINMRKGAGTSYGKLTAIPDGTEIVVTETKKADGYTWGKTKFDGYTGWCVLDFCDLVYKKPEPTKPTTKPTANPTTAPDTVPTTVTATVTEATEFTTVSMTTFVTDPSEVVTTVPITSAPITSVPDLTILPTDATEFSAPIISDTRPTTWADINGDGKTSIGDVTILQKHLASMDVTIDDSCADADGNGKISVLDATYIQKVLASIE